MCTWCVHCWQYNMCKVIWTAHNTRTPVCNMYADKNGKKTMFIPIKKLEELGNGQTSLVIIWEKCKYNILYKCFPITDHRVNRYGDQNPKLTPTDKRATWIICRNKITRNGQTRLFVRVRKWTKLVLWRTCISGVTHERTHHNLT